MERKIVGYHLDEEGDWVAELDCHHGQHVRNKPPFTNRPWVESEEGRAEKLGTTLNCVKCDRLEFPEGLIALRRTPDFTEATIPKGLLRDHNTKVGVWGVINVVSGSLCYRVNEPEMREYLLLEGEQGVVVPTMLHSVAAKGDVRFYVEFFFKE